MGDGSEKDWNLESWQSGARSLFDFAVGRFLVVDMWLWLVERNVVVRPTVGGVGVWAFEPNS